MLTHKAIDDVSRLYAAMAMLGLILNDPEMTKLYTRQHSDVFGLDHARTMEIMAAADKLMLAV